MGLFLGKISDLFIRLITKQHLFYFLLAVVAVYKADPILAQPRTEISPPLPGTIPEVCRPGIVNEAIAHLAGPPDIIIELGARIFPGNLPGLAVLHRSALTAQIFWALYATQGRMTPIIVSGGGGEAQVMDRLLRQHGIPQNYIYLETRSRNTNENARYSVRLMHELSAAGHLSLPQNILVVTTKVLHHGAVVDHHGRRAYIAFRRELLRRPLLTGGNNPSLASFTCGRPQLLSSSLILSTAAAEISQELTWSTPTPSTRNIR